MEAEHAEGTTSLFRSGGRPANPFRVVSSRATSWRLRVIHHGVSTSVPAAVISHPSTPPQDERTSVLTTFPWSMSTVLEATSKPHLRPVLPISPPLQQFSLSLSFPLPFGINRFLSTNSIFIYLFLSEGSHRHRDVSGSPVGVFWPLSRVDFYVYRRFRKFFVRSTAFLFVTDYTPLLKMIF